MGSGRRICHHGAAAVELRRETPARHAQMERFFDRMRAA
jgi:hypothetical protein